ncbi:hypothetical protein J4573_25720 [Actinomadura barringtoniae]|uniref:Uncharacterized protein n=1 Tax=Actinomadura barringtoniae TaxID=1427535 RepID=A0A939PE23_9ACTN|nr:hypothetical protein [Actinomadura barringtoniae]MBO2450527.1 hypothetical protein [Actinomadura barringtoniae]
MVLSAEELHDPPETVPEIAPGLHEVIAVSGDAGLDEEALESLGTPEEQRELAHRNLRALPIERHEVVHADEGGSYHVLSGETAFTAGRVLVLDDLAPRLTGGPIPGDGLLVTLPTKFHVLLHPITGGTVLNALAAMAEDTVGLFSANEARLSPHVYWWRDGAMERLTALDGQSLTFDFPESFHEMIGEIPEPVHDPVKRRRHHYHFVHTVLRQVSQDYGPTLLASTPAGDLTGMLEKTWRDVGEDLPADERLPADGLLGNLLELNDDRLMLVSLPEPTAAAEAYFAAMIQPSGADACRFFTLEYATDPITNEPGAILGEWVEEGHRLHLTGMTTEPEDFLQAIANLLGSGAPEDAEADPEPVAEPEVAQDSAPGKRRGLFRRR